MAVISNNPLNQMNQSRTHTTISFVPPKTIVLVGLMGAGKTSIGRRMAKRLELPFFDSDQEVEQAAGCSLKDIYDFYGEEEFRKGELRVIDRLLGQPTHILATGGGSFTVDSIRNVILQKSISVWLKSDLNTLIARVSRRSDRPFLGNEDPKAILEKLIEEHYPLYENSNIHVETFDEPTNATVDRVIQAMSNYIKENYENYYVLRSV